MNGITKYKGYSLEYKGKETIRDCNGCRQVRNTFMITNPSGEGVAKAWGMTEAKAIVNADIRGEL